MQKKMKLKICGLTDPREAGEVNAVQADFAGMVLFFPKSKRNISLEKAGEIMAELDPVVKRVAVVVAPSLEQMAAIERAGFDYIQVHGALPDGYAERIHLPVLKAFNITDMDCYEQYHADPAVAGYVFDAQEPGSGKTFDWSMVKMLPRDEKLLILAGGLRPENVAEAVRYLDPDGVDVSSGVEYADGRSGKDPQRIRAFAAAARGQAKA